MIAAVFIVSKSFSLSHIIPSTGYMVDANGHERTSYWPEFVDFLAVLYVCDQRWGYKYRLTRWQVLFEDRGQADEPPR